jgi:hypothetical protein
MLALKDITSAGIQSLPVAILHYLSYSLPYSPILSLSPSLDTAKAAPSFMPSIQPVGGAQARPIQQQEEHLDPSTHCFCGTHLLNL